MRLFFKDCPDLKEWYMQRSFIKDKVGLFIKNNAGYLLAEEDEKVDEDSTVPIKDRPGWAFNGLEDFLKENYPEVFI